MTTPFPPGFYHWTLASTVSHPLRSFLAWRRQHCPRIGFSYAHWETSLHPEATVAQNLLMAAGETLSGDAPAQEAQARLFLEKSGLSALIPWMPLGAQGLELNPEEKNVAALACSLLSPGHTVVWDSRTNALDGLLLLQVQRLLSETSRTVLVITSDEKAWEGKSHGKFCATQPTVKLRAA